MNKLLIFCAGAGLGMASAYILDPALGGQRRLRLKAGVRQGRLGRRLGGPGLEQSTREVLARTNGLLAEIRSLVRQAELPGASAGAAGLEKQSRAARSEASAASSAPLRSGSSSPGADRPAGKPLFPDREALQGAPGDAPWLPAGYPMSLALAVAGTVLLGSLAAWLAGRLRA